MIRCLLIDDEPLALELLEDNLKHVSFITVLAKCRSAAEALPYLEAGDVDLLFCDIQMPGLTGLQLVRSLANKPMVVFVTAYDKFAVDSFDLDVLDYLVKPVPLDRFLRCCNKARQQYELKQSAGISTLQPRNHFFVHADYTLLKISFNDIEFIEGLKDYVKINLIGRSRPILSRISIKSLEAQLPTLNFFRVHKSYIINVDHVMQIRRGRVKTATAELPMSDNYRDVIARMTGRAVA